MWWTLNLTPNPTHVCIFWCRYLFSNQLMGHIPNSIGNLTFLQHLWAPFCVENWRVSLTRHVWTPLGEDSLKLWNQIFCNKDGKHLKGIDHTLGAQTSVWGDSEVAFPRVSGNWHPALSCGCHNGIIVSLERIVYELLGPCRWKGDD